MSQFPPVLKWMVAVMVVGGAAELLAAHVSPAAGYGLVLIVLFGFAADAQNMAAINAFFARLGLVAEGSQK